LTPSGASMKRISDGSPELFVHYRFHDRPVEVKMHLNNGGGQVSGIKIEGAQFWVVVGVTQPRKIVWHDISRPPVFWATWAWDLSEKEVLSFIKNVKNDGKQKAGA